MPDLMDLNFKTFIQVLEARGLNEKAENYKQVVYSYIGQDESIQFLTVREIMARLRSLKSISVDSRIGQLRSQGFTVIRNA